MFYFSHPFGISTPSSSANNDGNVKSNEPKKKASKYTTTTYLVTEIQKNHSDGSQDEVESKKPQFTDRELIPWPKNFLLPPLIQLIEKKHGKTYFVYLLYSTRPVSSRANEAALVQVSLVTQTNKQKYNGKM